MIIKPWAHDFNLKEEVLRTIPLWVKLPNLPLNCWTTTTLSKIGSGLGKPLCADACTSNVERISYARLLVEIDVTQQMKEKIKYEWRPMYCTKCCQVGHVCREENLHVEKPRGKKVWRKARVLDPNTNPLIDDKGRYKTQLVGKGEKGKEKMQEEQQWSNPVAKSARKVAQQNLQEVGTSNGFETLEYYGQVGRNEAGQEDELNRLVEGITYNHPT
ncbi:hypothetical protein R3W88_032096 [Solanum pinnatisectum]|uniref:DUF4283 domain-containing protein n=1 Tax=Solanum pinnatisectum TaxID=50273 RepID=A0AAV9LN83_9SOLN|nr:hypothetical protein R3W88_032096 [Solanum pinnatisectum]